MIKKLIIENYRSISYVEVEIKELNAFIGANSAGKSNILKALNLVLGQTYPSIKSVCENDFYEYDTNNVIKIDILFERGLSSNTNVFGFRYVCDGTTLYYYALNQDYEELTYSNGREVRVSNEMKEEVTFMYLTLERLSTQQIRSSQWTIYGKLLKYIANSISQEDSKKFITSIQKEFQEIILPYVNDPENMLKQYVKEQTGKDINLKLSLIDPSFILKDLRPRITDEEGFEVDIEVEGAGVQSAVAIAIARTYAKVTNLPIIIGIEEPELFLHPHACRHFYRILKDLAQNGIQVFYSSHERSFVNIQDYQFINLVKKQDKETSVDAFKGDVDNFDEIKIAAKFDEELNEVFFASQVIFVEGPADKIATKTAFEHLGLNLDAYNISVVDCGSISGIKPLAEMLVNFNIKCFAIVDEDPGNPVTEKHTKAIESVLNSENVFVQTPSLEGLFNKSNKFTKESALKEIPAFYSANEIQQFYKDIMSKLNIKIGV